LRRIRAAEASAQSLIAEKLGTTESESAITKMLKEQVDSYQSAGAKLAATEFSFPAAEMLKGLGASGLFDAAKAAYVSPITQMMESFDAAEVAGISPASQMTKAFDAAKLAGVSPIAQIMETVNASKLAGISPAAEMLKGLGASGLFDAAKLAGVSPITQMMESFDAAEVAGISPASQMTKAFDAATLAGVSPIAQIMETVNASKLAGISPAAEMLKGLGASGLFDAAKLAGVTPIAQMMESFNASKLAGISPAAEMLKGLGDGLRAGLKGLGEEMSAPVISSFAGSLSSRSQMRLIEQLSSGDLGVALGKLSPSAFQQIFEVARSADAEALTPAEVEKLVEQIEPENINRLASQATADASTSPRTGEFTRVMAAVLLVIAIMGVLLLSEGAAAAVLVSTLQTIGMALALLGYADSHIDIVHGVILLLMFAAAKGRSEKRSRLKE
jgi:hypothetical protein